MCHVYLLHFLRPISDKHTCQHYIGSTEALRWRLGKHRADPDARLLQVAKERGIEFTPARVWSGARGRISYARSAIRGKWTFCLISRWTMWKNWRSSERNGVGP
ncbi:MAG: hypothetical protein U0350_36270 [Caldilineaceae bacterium]